VCLIVCECVCVLACVCVCVRVDACLRVHVHSCAHICRYVRLHTRVCNDHSMKLQKKL